MCPFVCQLHGPFKLIREVDELFQKQRINLNSFRSTALQMMKGAFEVRSLPHHGCAFVLHCSADCTCVATRALLITCLWRMPIQQAS